MHCSVALRVGVAQRHQQGGEDGVSRPALATGDAAPRLAREPETAAELGATRSVGLVADGDYEVVDELGDLT